jgi:hypothetical protein
MKTSGDGLPGTAKVKRFPRRLTATTECAAWPGPSATVAVPPLRASAIPDGSARVNVIEPA